MYIIELVWLDHCVIVVVWVFNKSMKTDEIYAQTYRLYDRLCYDKGYKISPRTFKMINNKINSTNINSITEKNDSCD